MVKLIRNSPMIGAEKLDPIAHPPEYVGTNPLPIVGMPATLCYGSDAYPATVVSVSKSRRTAALALDEYRVVSGDGSFQTMPLPQIEYTPGTQAARVAHLTARGWRVGGVRGTPVAMGVRRYYRDPHR